MKKSERIIETIKENAGWLRSTDVDRLAGVEHLSYTSALLSKLAEEQKLERKREGRGFVYRWPRQTVFLDRELNLALSDESQVFSEVRGNAEYQQIASERAQTILEFAFTEMLNNAKDHSGSLRGHVRVWAEQGVLKFVVRDYGVGVFRHVMRARGLIDGVEAIQDLVKGKVTTHPRKHSGEGIFWTSKMADKFRLASFDLALLVDNLADDYAIEKLDLELGGTEVYFELAAETGKSAAEIFREFSLDRETYSFDTTEVPLKLYNGGDFWVSRSQARRVLTGLEKYRKVIIDFKGIDLVGQGFADEVFRVFNIEHPDVWLVPVNMSESVRMMVERVMHDQTGRQG